MWIKKVEIQNYRCYFGNNVFEFDKGLNIILGENDEGKTKFFEAIDWVFKNNTNLEKDVTSKKALKELEEFQVYVKITFEKKNKDIAEVKRYFEVFDIKNTTSFQIKNSEYESIHKPTVLNSVVPGKGFYLLNTFFPTKYRKYSLFKGESDLNLFEKDPNALIDLINTTSFIKHFSKFPKLADQVFDRHKNVITENANKNKKAKDAINALEEEINILKEGKQIYLTKKSDSEKSIEQTNKQIEQINTQFSNSESLNKIEKQLNKLNDKVEDIRNRIDENYTVALFDKNWILMHFSEIQKEYNQKVTDLSHKKREVEFKFQQEIGEKKGEEKILAKLIDLPLNMPSEEYMERMLKEHYCMLCQTSAPVGSEAYSFIQKKLEVLRESRKPKVLKVVQPQSLFTEDNIGMLEDISVRFDSRIAQINNISNVIEEHFNFNIARTEDLNKELERVATLKDERSDIVSNSSLNDVELMDIAPRLAKLYESLNSLQNKERDNKTSLENKEKAINAKELELQKKVEATGGNEELNFQTEILENLKKIVSDTKEQKFNEYLKELEEKSNQFLDKINAGGFTGILKLEKDTNSDKVIIKHLSENGDLITGVNKSLKTSTQIAILFAISQIVEDNEQEKYPMIFDAPISDFGDKKKFQFLNLLNDIEGQKILLLKDYLNLDKEKNEIFVKDEFNEIKRDKAFHVFLDRPFDRKDQTTINSSVKVIK